MKCLIVALVLLLITPTLALAGTSTDIALGLGAFAVFNQIVDRFTAPRHQPYPPSGTVGLHPAPQPLPQVIVVPQAAQPQPQVIVVPPGSSVVVTPPAADQPQPPPSPAPRSDLPQAPFAAQPALSAGYWTTTLVVCTLPNGMQGHCAAPKWVPRY